MGHTSQSTPVGTPIKGPLLEHMRGDTPIGAGLVEHTYWNTYQSTSIITLLLEHAYRRMSVEIHLSEHTYWSTSTAARLLEHTYEHIYWSKPIVAHLLETTLNSCPVTRRYDSLELAYCYELHANQEVHSFICVWMCRALSIKATDGA